MAHVHLPTPARSPRERGSHARRRFQKDYIIPVIGMVTPTAILVVNVSLFIAHHIVEFRWSITVLAFVSGIMLNSWAALAIFGLLRGRSPEHPLVSERNREIVFVSGMLVVIVITAVTSYFCYRGLSNPAALPNALSMITAGLALAIPVTVQRIAKRISAERKRED